MRDRSLRRGTDCLEDVAAWVLTVVGMVVVIVAGVLGLGAYSQGMERVRSDQDTLVQATAVLLRDASDRFTEPASAAPFVGVPARWVDEAGIPHEGLVRARSDSRAGAQVQVWLDRAGALARPPVGGSGAVLNGLVIAVAVLALGGCMIVTLWTGLRWMTVAHNTRAWEREWARVGPEWNSQQPT